MAENVIVGASIVLLNLTYRVEVKRSKLALIQCICFCTEKPLALEFLARLRPKAKVKTSLGTQNMLRYNVSLYK